MFELVSELRKDSTPGYPYNLRYTNYHQMLYKEDELDPLKVEELRSNVNTRISSIMSGDYVIDPIHVFPKLEPHKLSKIQEGRYRLISGVSVVDNLIARHIWKELFNDCVDRFRSIPIKIGFSPICGGSRHISTSFDVGVMADRSSWDWTVQEFELEDCLQVIHNLRPGVPSHFLHWAKKIFSRPLFHVYGNFVQQTSGGMMKSGFYLTTFMNSIFQMLLHSYACLELELNLDYPFCVGDDTLQDSFGIVTDSGELINHPKGTYIGKLQSYGHIVRDVHVGTRLDFAGFVYDGIYCSPAYGDKHAFNILHVNQKVEVEALLSYVYIYSMERDPDRALFLFNYIRRYFGYYDKDFEDIRSFALGFE